MNHIVKYVIITLAWLLFIGIALSSNKDTRIPEDDIALQNNNMQLEQSTEKTTEDVDVSRTTASSALLDNYIENVVFKYNEQATDELVFVESFTPSAKENSHYRTEFRLSAYTEAVGRSYLLGDKVIDIVARQNILNEIYIRIYTRNAGFEQIISLIQGMSPIMDDDLTTEELKSTITELSAEKTANGYCYGDLGISLFGNDIDGYELMIKND